MRILSLVIALALVLGACRKQAETEVTETRPATMRDENLKLDATSNERFGSGGATPALPKPAAGPTKSPVVAGHVPEAWTELPGNAFRLLNYSFGNGGEVSVSLSRGGVIDNVNRWVGQFGRPVLDAAGMDALEKLKVAGFSGVLLKVDGDYAPGMGRPAQKGSGLLGLVVEKGGDILTVKMVGSAAEVGGQEANFRAFLEGLKPVE